MKPLLLILLLTATAQAVFVGTKTSTVFHATTCRYAATATAYSWPTYEDAVKFGRVPCKTCKPMPTPIVAEPNIPYDINSPVYGETNTEWLKSLSDHITAAEKMLPTMVAGGSKENLFGLLLMWNTTRASMLYGVTPQMTEIALIKSQDEYALIWRRVGEATE